MYVLSVISDFGKHPWPYLPHTTTLHVKILIICRFSFMLSSNNIEWPQCKKTLLSFRGTCLLGWHVIHCDLWLLDSISFNVSAPNYMIIANLTLHSPMCHWACRNQPCINITYVLFNFASSWPKISVKVYMINTKFMESILSITKYRNSF